MYYITARSVVKKQQMESNPMKQKTVLFPRRMCETLSGDLAHTVGRLAFRPGRPMLVEHVGGIYLEHDLTSGVITPGYGDEYNIVHVCADECPASPFATKSCLLKVS
jgi:hypothetical protein